MSAEEFTEEQKQYLQGFAAGSGLLQSMPTFAGTLGVPAGKSPEVVAGPEAMHRIAQDRFIAAGKKLCPEEQSKREIGCRFGEGMIRGTYSGRLGGFPVSSRPLLGRLPHLLARAFHRAG